MRRTGTFLVVAVLAAGSALGVSHAGDKIIEVQLPPEEPVPGSEQAVPEVVVPLDRGGDRNKGAKIRREHRKVEGEPPTAVFGTWAVVQLTELGETEDYKLKMERAGKALDEDCIITDTWFDFGPPSSDAGLPAELTVTQVQTCEKGGLGMFASETSVTTAISWTTQGGVAMEMPEVRAEQQLIRLRAAADHNRAASNWVGPDIKVDRATSRYEILAEYPTRKKGAGRPKALHFIAGNGVTWHLEPLGAEG